jgi:hypothetical protein
LLYKSFIYDNTAVIFKTVGNPYRKPGRFIILNGGYEEDRNSSANGYWFVIGIKHIFENEIYSNEITAVKIFIEDKNGLINAEVSQTVNPAAVSKVTPSIKTNTNDFIEPNNNNNNLPELPVTSESNDNVIDASLLPDISQGEPVIDNIQPTETILTDDVNIDVPIPEGEPFSE